MAATRRYPAQRPGPTERRGPATRRYPAQRPGPAERRGSATCRYPETIARRLSATRSIWASVICGKNGSARERLATSSHTGN